jgi:iron complex transport system ATP-binding protein
MNRRPILAIKKLSIRRGAVTILEEIDWTVQPREHWVMLGANGSGKTSLLSALTGYLTPTSGDIHVLGKEFGASDWRALRQAIGIVSSSVRQLMHDEDSALEIAAGGLTAQIGHWGAMPKTSRAAALKALQLAEARIIAERPWGVLSQGERQRTLIARALIAYPRLLILDEPCAGLDPVAREHFLAFIQRLAQAPRAPALVLVTHHVEEITPAFTHALLLRDGRIAASGPLAKALTTPNLTRTFAAPLQLSRRRGRYQLSLS